MNEGACQQLALIYSIFGDDPDLADLVELYVEEMPENLQSVRQLCESRSWLELGRLAHQIKGSAGSYGFVQITPFAVRLEEVARTEAPASKIELASLELIEACRRLRAGRPEQAHSYTVELAQTESFALRHRHRQPDNCSSSA